MTRESIVLALAERIEQEMRSIGMWSDAPPPPGASEIKEAFGGSALSLEQWLQYVFLSRVRGACAEKSLPRTSEVGQRAYREWVMHGPDDPRDRPLIELLFELDGVVSFHPAIERIGFFETGRPAQSKHGRDLGDRFHQADVRSIAWQLELSHPDLPRALAIAFDWKYILEDGTLFAEQKLEITLDPSWKTSWHMSSWGFAGAGHWQKGTHTFVIRLWEAPFAEAKLTID